MPNNIQPVLDSLKQKWNDTRSTVFAVRAETGDGAVRLMGEVLESAQRAETEQAIRRAAPGAQVVNDIAVLSRPDNPCGLVRRALANLRRTPDNAAELLAQGLFGEPVELIKHEPKDNWWLVRLADGYLGWLEESCLYVCDRETAQAYRASATALVVAELPATFSGWVVAGGNEPEGLRSGRLPFGVPVTVAERHLGMVRVNWKGEPPVWVCESDLIPMSRRPRPDAAGIARSLDLMGRFVGVPYLWGGETPFGYDCSGFAQTMMEFMGVSVPRDADQQFMAGQAVEGEPQPGDLLFFSGNSDDDPTVRHASITHVAVSLGGTEFIHSTGYVWGVTRNSLDPASPIYRAGLKEHLAGVRRFV